LNIGDVRRTLNGYHTGFAALHDTENGNPNNFGLLFSFAVKTEIL